MFTTKRRLLAVATLAVLAVAAVVPASAGQQNFYPYNGSCVATGEGNIWTEVGGDYITSEVWETSCSQVVAARVTSYHDGAWDDLRPWIVDIDYAYQWDGDDALSYGYSRGQVQVGFSWGPVISTSLMYP
ncbi:MAG: hypothetical protein ACSLFM_08450 [Tepidiformaceae bacterium]